MPDSRPIPGHGPVDLLAKLGQAIDAARARRAPEPTRDVADSVEVYPFHLPVVGMPDLFHVRCDVHGPIFGCGPRGDADRLRADHIEQVHKPSVEEKP